MRARYYASDTGRLISQDIWQGNVDNPITLNHWVYANANPVNYTDPSGNCSTCFVFYFSGAGNTGLDQFTEGEKAFIGNLSIQSQATVIPIYPYYVGNSDTSIVSSIIQKYLPQAYGTYETLTDVVRVGTLASGGQFPIPESKARAIYDLFSSPCNLNPDLNLNNFTITFIGYSGGSQVSYSAAQALRGKLFIDNLVALGPFYHAFSGLGNIGHIWNLAGQDDQAALPARAYYDQGSTSCILLRSPGHEYIHFGQIPGTKIDLNDYFDFTNGTNGTVCGDATYTYSSETSRALALIEYLVNIVGVGKPK